MNWLKFQALQKRNRLDPKRATMKQMKQIEAVLAEAETVKAILITSNLRLVVSIAKKFNEPSHSFDELISEGNVALMRSVEKFNFAHMTNRFVRMQPMRSSDISSGFHTRAVSIVIDLPLTMNL